MLSKINRVETPLCLLKRQLFMVKHNVEKEKNSYSLNIRDAHYFGEKKLPEKALSI